MAEREDASSTRTESTLTRAEGAASMNAKAPAGSVTAAEMGESGGEPEAPPKRELKRSARIGLIVAGIVLGVIAVAGGIAYFMYTNQFVTTDNAQVDGDQIQINAPATGTVADWKATQGSQVRRNQPVGRIQMQGSGAQPQQIIRAPGDGTIASNPTVEGQWVTAGTNLATAYNGNGIYVTARVDETDVADVRVGAPVDIDVDARHLSARVRLRVFPIFSVPPHRSPGTGYPRTTSAYTTPNGCADGHRRQTQRLGPVRSCSAISRTRLRRNSS